MNGYNPYFTRAIIGGTAANPTTESSKTFLGSDNAINGKGQNVDAPENKAAVEKALENNPNSDKIREGKPLDNHSTIDANGKMSANGPPDSSVDLLNEDGSVKQRRYYDSTGKVTIDVDFNHQDDGTYQFPHTHAWDWILPNPRSDARK